MPNPNEFTGTPWGSQYFTRRMRRINALEQDNWRWVEDWSMGFNVLGMAVYEDELYVVSGGVTVRVYDLEGTLQRSFNAGNNCRDVSVYDDEVYLLCDGSTNLSLNHVEVRSLTGTLDRQWDMEEDPGLPSDPNHSRLHASSAGVFVTCTSWLSGWGCIQAFDTDGNWSWTAGDSGTGDGEFETTAQHYDLAVLGSYLWICDPDSRRIQKWDTAGNFVSNLGSEGSDESEFGGMMHVAFDSDSLMYISSITPDVAANGRVQVFNGMTFHREFGAAGLNDGGIQYARDLAIVGDLAYVAYGGGPSYISVWTRAQTEFYRYTAVPQSLGTPDGGVSVPGLEALVGYRHAPRIYKDMRDAIERLAWSGAFRNVITGNKFNWTNASADNLYYVAMGDRTDFGATGGAKYDWTRTRSVMNADLPRDIDLGEIDRCIQVLEAS